MDALMDVSMNVLREKDDEMRRRRKKGTIDQIYLFICLGTVKLMRLTLFHNRSRYLACFLPFKEQPDSASGMMRSARAQTVVVDVPIHVRQLAKSNS
jgi:hypothetical protein